MIQCKNIFSILLVILLLQGCPLLVEEEGLVEPPVDTQEPVDVEPAVEEVTTEEPIAEETTTEDANEEPVVVTPVVTLDDIDVVAIRADLKSSIMKLSAAVEQVADTTDTGLENIINEDFAILENIVYEMSGGDEEANLGGLIGDALEKLVATQSADRSHVVYALTADHVVKICGDDQDCSALYSKISLAQYFNAGKLELHYTLDGVVYVPLVIGYSNSEWYIESKMLDLKNMVVASNTGSNSTSIPLTAEGAVRATISQVDEVTVEAVIDVTSDINIQGKIGSKDTDQVSLQVASSKAIKVTSAADTGKLTITANMGTLAGMFYGESYVGYDPVTYDDIFEFKKFEITSAGIVGTVELDFANKKATATGLGLKNGGIEIKEDGVVALAITTSISNYTLLAPGENDIFVAKVMADTAAEVMIEGSIFGEDESTQGVIGVSATAGTIVELYEAVYSLGLELAPDYAKVAAGTVTGFEAVEGMDEVVVSASADQCLGEPLTNEGFPTVIECPIDIPSVLTIETFSNGGQSQNVDLEMYLFSSLDLVNEIYYNDDYNGLYPGMSFVPTSGETYYIRIGHLHEGSAAGGYSIRVSDAGPGGSSVVVPVDETSSANNDSTGATTLDLNVIQDHTLTSGDVDWFMFTVPVN